MKPGCRVSFNSGNNRWQSCKDVYARVLSNVQYYTEETKILALDVLDIKVYANTWKVEI